MVKHYRGLDATFGALADPTRRAILAALLRGRATVTELAKPHRMSLPAVTKHLRVLRRAGLISQEKIGRTRHCSLAARPLENAEAWLSRYRIFWEAQFDSLEKYLAKDQTKEAPKWPSRKSHRTRRSK